MERRKLGGVSISRLGLGTMTWGRDTDENEAAQQLQYFVEAGGNLIDTAAVYGDGDAERVLGGFIGTLVKRDQLFIASKAGITFKDGLRQVNNSRNELISDLDRTLTRLNVDYLDMWQIHTWDKNTPLEETLSALDYATSSGKARYVSVCNFNGWQLARSATLQNPIFGKAAITSAQNEYSLLNRRVEEEVIPAATALNLGFLAWSPLGRGVLTGKYLKGKSPEGARGTLFPNYITRYQTGASEAAVLKYLDIANRHQMTLTELSLAFVNQLPFVTSNIIGATKMSQLKENIGSIHIELSKQTLQEIQEVHAMIPNPAP